ncbi:MAG: protein-glutamine glutaminase family protein [Bdellovibrio sp.]
MKFLMMTLFLLSASLVSLAKGLSPRRFPNESFESARRRSYFISNVYRSSRKTFPVDVTKSVVSPEDAQKSLNDLNVNEIADIGSYADLETEFKFIRDSRFINTEDPKFPRRITWLYPDDGCYARAEYAKIQALRRHFAEPKKIFVFGDLFALTPNTSSGEVSWWYHVALTYRVGQDVYIFDPSLETHHPLTLNEWNKLIGGTQTTLQYSICSADTYDPTSDCFKPVPETVESTTDVQKSFLGSEWDRLIELNRNPLKELGDSPPWL